MRLAARSTAADSADARTPVIRHPNYPLSPCLFHRRSRTDPLHRRVQEWAAIQAIPRHAHTSSTPTHQPHIATAVLAAIAVIMPPPAPSVLKEARSLGGSAASGGGTPRPATTAAEGGFAVTRPQAFGLRPLAAHHAAKRDRCKTEPGYAGRCLPLAGLHSSLPHATRGATQSDAARPKSSRGSDSDDGE
jgi:hypothetical protein